MDGIIVTAKRKKAPKVFSHLEIHGQPGGVQIEQHFTDEAHQPKSYELRTRPLAHTRAVQTGICDSASRDAIRTARPQSAEASFTRRRNKRGGAEPAWTKSGLFKSGFNIGPRLRGAKLFTKGKAKE